MIKIDDLKKIIEEAKNKRLTQDEAVIICRAVKFMLKYYYKNFMFFENSVVNERIAELRYAYTWLEKEYELERIEQEEVAKAYNEIIRRIRESEAKK